MKVYFPAVRQEPDPNATAAIATPASSGSGELILLVEDEPAVRKITSRTLEARDYNLLTAADGAEAGALYAKHQRNIHLVLIDMMMPVMDGAATIQVLKRVNPRVRIIAAARNTNTEDPVQTRVSWRRSENSRPVTMSPRLSRMTMLLIQSVSNSVPK